MRRRKEDIEVEPRRLFPLKIICYIDGKNEQERTAGKMMFQAFIFAGWIDPCFHRGGGDKVSTTLVVHPSLQ